MFGIKSRRYLVIPVLLAAALGGWWVLRDDENSVSPVGPRLKAAAQDSSKQEGPDLEALVRKAGPETRHTDLNKALEDALDSGMKQEDQLDLIRRLKESGMDTAELERLVDQIWWKSEDPEFLLQLADLLDAGNKKRSVMEKAFGYVTKDKLPMFTEVLLAIPSDSFRQHLAGIVIDRILADGDFAFTAKWVDSVEGPVEKLQYVNMMKSALLRGMNSSAEGKPPVSIKELTAYFTGDVIFNMRASYGAYYINRDDFDSLKDVYAGLAENEMLNVIELSIMNSRSISANRAEELLSLAPEGDRMRRSIAIQVVEKIRVQDGDAAADAFRKAHLEAVIKQ